MPWFQKLFLSASLFIWALSLQGKEKETFRASKVAQTPKIDGDLSDVVWNQNTSKIQFYQFAPANGSPSEFHSSIQILYTDKAIYVGAQLHDPDPDKILKEFGKRDDMDRNADIFGFMVDPYNSGINAFSFFVSAAGVQGDYFMTGDDFDQNWDAIWKSAVKITEHGWSVELEIPYFAIRFPKQIVQNWKINFYRNIKRKREESYWNHVDNSINGIVNQFGALEGVENIQPPLRLSFSPYITALYTHSGVANKGAFSFAGGMDLKYGINESYTLDMSLVPDFSQVQSDNIVYNISPFEVQFNENRQFFTEGTDLFNKNGIFYSRRVGQTFGTPIYNSETEEIRTTPNAANLINATKLSGRNKKGLGLGLFNALTNETYATIQNKESGETREALVDPLTNFNVFVIDQNLKNNSNINFTNTSVVRSKEGRDATVSSANLRLRDKSNTYQIVSFVAISNITNTSQGKRTNDVGYKYTIDLSKISGKWQYGIFRNVESHNYNPNDLGYLRAPNEISHRVYGRYSILKPIGKINLMRTTISAFHQDLQKPQRFAFMEMALSNYIQFKNFWGFEVYLGANPTNGRDFFEPRTQGRYFIQPQSYDYNIFVESDNRKALQANAYTGRWHRPSWGQSFNWWGYYTRYRASNKISFSFETNYEHGNSRGFAKNIYDETDNLSSIIFGERDVLTTSNVFGFNYTFNAKMGLTLRVRHYWTKVHYTQFFELGIDGDLYPTTYSGINDEGVAIHNANFNAVNLDLVYFWQIAPGSFINIVWKDAVQSFSNDTSPNYFSNLEGVSKSPQSNSISIRLTYFIDYLTLKKSLSRVDE